MFVKIFLSLLVTILTFVTVPFLRSNNNQQKHKASVFIDTTVSAKLPPLARAKGVTFADVDNDKDADVFYSLPYGTSKLLKNNKGHFWNATHRVGLASHSATATFFVDIDNDGDLDIFINEVIKKGRESYSSPVLYQNTKNYFTNVSKTYNIHLIQKKGIGTAAFGDYDNDSFLDVLLVYNEPFKKFNFPNDPGISERIFTLEKRMPIKIVPSTDGKSVYASFQGTILLLKNIQGKFFDDASHLLPLLDTTATFWQPIFFDYNQDNKQDIFIATDFGHSYLLQNRGSDGFKDVSTLSGLQEHSFWMGVDVVDLNKDKKPDIYSTSIQGDGVFLSSKDNVYSLITKINRTGVGWGGLFIDYDNDGQQDIFACNGDLFFTFFPNFENNKETYGFENFTREDLLYKNENNSFRKQNNVFDDNLSCQGAAIADINNDGFSDLLVGNEFRTTNEASKLYMNKGNKNNWIKVKLRGTKSNTFGVGSAITVSSKHFQNTQYVLLGNSFYSQSSFEKIFGLSDNDKEKLQITVQWPSGILQTIETTKRNTILVIKEPYE